MTARRLTLVLAAGAFLLPGAASAQDDGVFTDPDSPANEEYAIPAEEERDRANPDRRGGDGPAGPSGRRAFGAGVGEDGQSGSGDGSADGSGDGSEGGGDGESRSDRRDKADPGDVDEDAQRVLAASGSQPVPDGGGGSLLAILGSAALVVLIGAGGGALLRRRGRP